ncbi:MAG TPA: cell cycle protein, partial [Treponema sp.]|nr:cell cycle protein [Treponema sp.]
MSDFKFFADKPASTYRKSDSTLIILTFLLWAVGIVTLYFCSSGYGVRAFN